MGLKWDPTQVAIASMLKPGKATNDITEHVKCSRQLVNKVRKALKAGDNPPVTPPAGIANPPADDNSNKPPAGTPLHTAFEVARNKPPHKSPAAKEEEPAKLPKITTETVDATILQLIPQVQQVPLTPGIYNGFLCARIRGFPGTIADWLELASVDFWTGRGKNPFAIVGGYASSENEGGQDGG